MHQLKNGYDGLGMHFRQPVAQRGRVRDEFYDSSLCSEGNDCVAADVKRPTSSLAVGLEDLVHKTKDLFHHSILPHVILPLSLKLVQR